ncbi:MAG: hypothetical protein GY793_08760 [Proteobacteria bacterium]|nr:hypothetical protein [Pseudomonadota bacterium]
MTKLFKQFAIFAVVLGLATVISGSAFASETAGEGLFTDFTNALKGKMGTTAGLAVSLVGLYIWLWNQVSWGIVVAIGGALLTAFPGIYTSLQGFGKDVFSESIPDAEKTE